MAQRRSSAASFWHRQQTCEITPAIASLVAAELALLEAEAAGQPARAELPAQPTAAAAHGVLPPGRSALLRRPYGLELVSTAAGNTLVISDTGNNRIRSLQLP